MLEVMKEDGKALEYADKALMADREFMLSGGEEGGLGARVMPPRPSRPTARSYWQR